MRQKNALAAFRQVQQADRARRQALLRDDLLAGQVFAGFFAATLLILSLLLLLMGLVPPKDSLLQDVPPGPLFGAAERFRLAGLHYLVLAAVYSYVTVRMYRRWPLAAALLTLLLSGLAFWNIAFEAEGGFVLTPLNALLLTVPFWLLAALVAYRSWLPWRRLLPVFGVVWGTMLVLRLGGLLLPQAPNLHTLDASDLLAALMGLTVAVVAVVANRQQLQHLFRWRAGHLKAARQIIGHVVLYTAAVQLVLAGIVAWVGVDIQHHISHNIQGLPSLAMGLLGWVVLPAVVEEVVYRGCVQGQLTRVLRPQAAWLLTAVVFAASHHSFISLLWLLPFGLYLGYLRARYRSLWLPMLAHGWYNALVLLVDLFTA